MSNHNNLTSLFTDIADSIRNKTGSSNTIVADNFPTEISNLSTPYSIKVAEFSGVNISVKDSNNNLVESVSSTGGIYEFNISTPGSYSVTVTDLDSLIIWNLVVVISDKGIYYAKGRVLNDMIPALIHTACQLGIASKMFSLRDVWTFKDSNSIMNNMKFYIVDFIKNNNGTESIQFWLADLSYSTIFQLIQKRSYSNNGNTWASLLNSTAGGYKYSDLRREFLPTGSEIYTQAYSIIPDSSPLTEGIEFSKLEYSDTKEKAELYTYNSSTDTFTIDSTFRDQTVASPFFIKGYFKSVGELSEDQFNAGYYYTRTTSGSGVDVTQIFTPASSYDSSTSYYGFYEFLQEDGVLYNAFKSLIDEGYLHDMELKLSTGLNQRTIGNICNDEVSIPSLGELLGQKYNGILPSGVATGNLSYGDPSNYINNELSGVNYNDLFGSSGSVWLRSVCCSNASTFSCLSGSGYVSNASAAGSYRIRPMFRFN